MPRLRRGVRWLTGVMICVRAERTFDMRNTTRALGACLLIVTVCAAGLRGAGSDVADAVMNRDNAALQALLKKKADVNAPQRDGATALHWAVYHDDAEAADVLLRAGAKPAASTAPACRRWRWRRSTAARRSSIGC